MFLLDPASQVLHSTLLLDLPWLQHGFGTRLSVNWPGATVTVKQIHSDIVMRAGEIPSELGEADALVSNAAAPVSIRTADCVPILIADPVHQAVAAIHAGWRGTASGIVLRAVEAMQCDFGSNPADLAAAIGPAIGKCCYEVSADVAMRFDPSADPDGKAHIDLSAINARQLEAAGVRHIDSSGACTRCNAVLYESFRRDGVQSGRMHAVIGKLEKRPKV